jgi:hypothetical protein
MGVQLRHAAPLSSRNRRRPVQKVQTSTRRSIFVSVCQSGRELGRRLTQGRGHCAPIVSQLCQLAPIVLLSPHPTPLATPLKHTLEAPRAEYKRTVVSGT